MIHFFDFVFRGIIVLGALVMIFNNFRKIRRNRIENENRKVLKYYHTIFNLLPIYLNYITSALIGLSVFRVGSFLFINQKHEVYFKFLQFQLASTEEVLQNEALIIVFGIMGVAIYMFLCMFLSASFLQLGKNFSSDIDIREGNTLVKTGVYGIIRHPIYLSEMLLPFAVGMAMQNWLLFIWGLVMLPIQLARTKKEDELLSNHYGKEFENYCKDVNRFIPKRKSKKWIH